MDLSPGDQDGRPANAASLRHFLAISGPPMLACWEYGSGVVLWPAARRCPNASDGIAHNWSRCGEKSVSESSTADLSIIFGDSEFVLTAGRRIHGE